MQRSSIALVVMALLGACAAPNDDPLARAQDAFVEAPVVAHLDVGGVT